MGSTWKHAKLGVFKLDSIYWSRTIEIPAFKAFAGVSTWEKSKPTGKIPLNFNHVNLAEPDAEKKPSKAMVTLALKVIANQKKLVSKVVNALWDDFHGDGPGSEMWWYDDLDQVMDAMEAEEPLNDAKELLSLLRPSSITIYQSWPEYAGPIAEICFNASFEEEHGIGMLTDGTKILGIGYMSDVSIFNSGENDDDTEDDDDLDDNDDED